MGGHLLGFTVDVLLADLAADARPDETGAVPAAGTGDPLAGGWRRAADGHDVGGTAALVEGTTVFLLQLSAGIDDGARDAALLTLTGQLDAARRAAIAAATRPGA